MRKRMDGIAGFLTVAVLFLIILLLLTGCGKSTDTVVDWKEQYDLGIRYLEEENYEQAIVAFTAAIEIDPNQPEVYVARGRAYVLRGETEENLSLAQADYEMAINLDETFAEAYLGLADIYIRKGEYERALEILQEGLEKTGGDENIKNKIAEIESGNITDSENKVRKVSGYDETGNLLYYYVYFYNETGQINRKIAYDKDDMQTGDVNVLYDENGNCIQDWCSMFGTGEIVGRCIQEYDSKGNVIKTTDYDLYEDTFRGYQTYEYDDAGNLMRFDEYNATGRKYYYHILETYSDGNEIDYVYTPEGILEDYSINEYDENKNLIKGSNYNAEGILLEYSIYEYDDEGNQISEHYYTEEAESEE